MGVSTGHYSISADSSDLLSYLDREYVSCVPSVHGGLSLSPVRIPDDHGDIIGT